MRGALLLASISGWLGCSCFAPVGEGSSGGSGTGSSTTGGSGGTGSSSCGFNLVWDGERCISPSCAEAPEGVGCDLDDGGFGNCYGERCQSGLDFTSDPNNCGEYGRICPIGTRCNRGWCSDSDGGAAHCGSAVCPPGTQCLPDYFGFATCVTAACGPETVEDACALLVDGAVVPGACCGSSCISFRDNPDHCGGCGVFCGDQAFCDHLTCRPLVDCSLAAGEVDCQLPGGALGHCCEGACTDIAHDPLHCGGCGRGCAVGSICDAGGGYDSTSGLLYWASSDLCIQAPLPDGGFTPGCLRGGACPAGRACGWTDACYVASCSTGTEGDACGVYWDRSSLFGGLAKLAVCCSSKCSELQQDPLNCGRCGQVCPPNTFCNEGACTAVVGCGTQTDGVNCPLAGGRAGICCQGACVDPTSDPQHCFACDRSCPPGAECQTTFGILTECALPGGGEADCGTLGCRTGSGCVNYGGFGVCRPLTCTEQSGQGFCAVVAGSGFLGSACCDGICREPRDTCGLSNCGPGGGPCVGGSECVSGECFPSSCRVRSDGDPCATAHASGAPPSLGICCGGACVDPGSDPNNCGGCGLTCDVCTPGFPFTTFPGGCLPNGPTGDCNATCGVGSICVRGICVDSTCRSGQDCLAEDGKVGFCCAENSCANLRSDPLNCGRCGVQCASGQTCAHGSCSG